MKWGPEPFQTQPFLGDFHYAWKLSHNSADITQKGKKSIQYEGYGLC